MFYLNSDYCFICCRTVDNKSEFPGCILFTICQIKFDVNILHKKDFSSFTYTVLQSKSFKISFMQVWSVMGEDQVQLSANRQLGVLSHNIWNERNNTNVFKGKSANIKNVQIYA